jgi:hypothetical protein
MMRTNTRGRAWSVVRLLAAAAMVTLVVSPATASATASGSDRQPVEVEFDGAAEFTSGGPTLGWSQLNRRQNGLEATVHVEGLRPGGVFTFWWTIPQGDFPGEWFVARGAGRVIGENGRATVHLSANLGDASIEGLPALDGASFGSLSDPLGAVVRVEIAYHGQVEDAGTDLDAWLSDFWTGAACPADGDVNANEQPFCPVYIAAEHAA